MRDAIDRDEILQSLLKLKPNEDYVYVAVKQPLFKTHDGYFGAYERPFRDTSYTVKCIKGESPQAYKLKKLLYLGMFESSQTLDKIFVFSDYQVDGGFDNELRFSGYATTWRQERWPTNYRDPPKISTDFFDAMSNNKDHQLDFDLIGFTKEEGLRICRELNGKWKNDFRYINFAESGLYIKKTLKTMLKQLDEFMRSECIVDPKEQIEKDLNG